MADETQGQLPTPDPAIGEPSRAGMDPVLDKLAVALEGS